MSEPDYQIYLIRHEHGFVKIGKSTDPERRYRDIRSYSPYTVELHTTLDAYDEEESLTGNTAENLLHSYYRHFSQKFEWFDLPDKEVRALTELDSIYSTDIECAIYDLHMSAYPGQERTIRDNLHTVWTLRAPEKDPGGAMQEVDR